MVIVAWGGAKTLGAVYKADYVSFAKKNPFNGLNKQSVQNLINKHSSLKSSLKNHVNDVNTSKQIDQFVEYLRKLVRLNNAENAFRGTTKTRFLESVAEFKIPSNGLLGDQAWNLWKDEKWTELETLFKNNNLNKSGATIWPPNRGFIDIVSEPLTVGKEIDRYGGYIDNVDGLYKDKGTFASPKGASFESRALTPETINKPYVKYKIVKEIPGVNKGQAIPWFGQKGKGIQYELPESIDDLLKGGYIVKIRDSWLGYSKIFKAGADEILEATSKIKTHRSTTGNLSSGNYGYLEGTVNGTVIDNKMWRSGPALADEPKIFTAIEVEGGGGKTWLRTTDSEYKMLNKLASDLGVVKGGKYLSIMGEFKIISENPYCASCAGIIQQFNEMFPNVKLILVDGAK